MMADKPLNLLLYNRIKATFKNVRIGNSSEKQERKRRIDFLTNKETVDIQNWGETYAVCCPFCNDTRFRCLINHRYGTVDEYQRIQNRLVVCFNAGCPLSLKKQECYDRLEVMLTGHKLFDLTKAEVVEGKEVDLDSFRMSWPGEVVRIDKLPQDHQAVVWLTSIRGFDVKKLGAYYNVHWCENSSHALCRKRIIIPIYMNKKMVGFQARAPFDIDWKLASVPKYYTARGTPKRQVIYNFGNMRKRETGIVVEGVTSVWRGGDSFGAILGASVTAKQFELLAASFKNHSVVFLLDPDVRKDAEKAKVLENLMETEKRLKAELAGGCCSVWLPDDTDPADFEQAFLYDYIASEAAKQGVKVSWKKIDG
jgi:hypothetical protein